MNHVPRAAGNEAIGTVCSLVESFSVWFPGAKSYSCIAFRRLPDVTIVNMLELQEIALTQGINTEPRGV
jgi:hypothetical protein